LWNQLDLFHQFALASRQQAGECGRKKECFFHDEMDFVHFIAQRYVLIL
jgi:hypothetical protein